MKKLVIILTLILISGCSLQSGKSVSVNYTLESPQSNQVVLAPLEISGSISGTWFFEGDLPVELRGSDDSLIAEGYVTAEGEWMTDESVDFSGVIETFDRGEYENGFFVLIKDNPSGLEEHDDEIKIPIRF